MTDHDYTMTISLNVLNHLGLNLYSNVPSVLSEVVANSYDADAEIVRVTIDPEARTVTILDDGHGTDATVRTLIDTSFGGETWTTVGVGTNVIEASWEALSDALAYGIMTHLDD